MTKKQLNPEAFNDWVYQDIDDYSIKEECAYGGAGSGKSVGKLQKLILKSLNYKRKVLVVRKVASTLKDSVFSLMLDELLPDCGILEYCKVNKSNYEIELPNGSIFLFKGLDNPEKIKSINGITDIFCEEATELTLDEYTQLNLRLRPKEPYPQIYTAFNPVSKANWVYDYFVVNPPKKAKVIQTNYKDNRFLPYDYVATLEDLKNRNPAYYRIYALGEFATLDKLVFPVYETRIIPEDEVREFPLFVGLDFGFNDPTALVWGRYDKARRRIYVTGEYYERELHTRDIADIIKSLGLSNEIIIADSQRADTIDELKTLHNIRRIQHAKKGKDSILHGLHFIHQHEFIVDKRLKDFITELENYTWIKDKKTGQYIDMPIDAYNHGIDALRYALERWHEDRTVKILQRSMFGGRL